MDNIISFNEKKKSAKAIITFNDGRMGNKNETRAYIIIKIFLLFGFWY